MTRLKHKAEDIILTPASNEHISDARRNAKAQEKDIVIKVEN